MQNQPELKLPVSSCFWDCQELCSACSISKCVNVKWIDHSMMTANNGWDYSLMCFQIFHVHILMVNSVFFKLWSLLFIWFDLFIFIDGNRMLLIQDTLAQPNGSETLTRILKSRNKFLHQNQSLVWSIRWLCVINGISVDLISWNLCSIMCSVVLFWHVVFSGKRFNWYGNFQP